jgi:hypothetical protein
VTSLSGTLLGCRRPYPRLALRNNLLPRKIIKIVLDNKSIAAPIYTSMTVYYKKDKEECM